MLYCRFIYMLSILCVRLTIKVKVGQRASKYDGTPPKKTGSSHLKIESKLLCYLFTIKCEDVYYMKH